MTLAAASVTATPKAAWVTLAAASVTATPKLELQQHCVEMVESPALELVGAALAGCLGTCPFALALGRPVGQAVAPVSLALDHPHLGHDLAVHVL